MTTQQSLKIETFPVGSFQCNCSLIYSTETREAIAIDPGNDAQTFLKVVQAKQLTLKMMIHTHAHFDHIGQSNFIKTQLGGVPIYLHQNDKTLYEKIILLRNNGIQRDPKLFSNKSAYDKNNILNPNHYEIQSIGLNFRASDLNCALGTNQLNKIEKFIIKRKEIVERYDEKFSDVADLLKPVKKFNFCNTSYHLYVVLIDFEKIDVTRAHMISQLKNRNIGVQVHYPPLHLQKIYGYSKKLSGSEEYYRKCLSLPLFPQLTFNDVDYVVKHVKNLINKT